MILKAGTLCLFTAGEYSDYSFVGLFRVLRDLPELPFFASASVFETVARLVQKGYLEELDVTEICLNDDWSTGQCRLKAYYTDHSEEPPE